MGSHTFDCGGIEDQAPNARVLRRLVIQEAAVILPPEFVNVLPSEQRLAAFATYCF